MNSPHPSTKRDIHIAKFTSSASGLEVLFSNSDQSFAYTWFWLRDHGIDEASLDPVTLQRRVDTFCIPNNLQAQSVTLENSKTQLQISWTDGSETSVSAQLLASVVGLAYASHDLLSDRSRTLWDSRSKLRDLPTVDFDAVMSSESELLVWLENIAVFGFSLVENVPTTDLGTEQLAARIGPTQETLFGRMWHLSAELEDHGDTAYSTEFLEPHTDTTYYHDAAGLQMFNCQEFNGKGGESVQVDGFAIAACMQDEHPEAYHTLCNIVVPGHYLEPGVHVRAERPVFKLDTNGQLVQVTFNNYDRAPMRLSPSDEKRFYHAYGLFREYAMDQENWLKIPLRPGMTLIFDNWRNLHGRMGYVGKRVFYGCYHSRALFESRLRTLRANA